MIIQLTPRGMLNTFFRHRYKFGSIFFLIFGLAAPIAPSQLRNSRAMPRFW